ncbi:MAG TPA: hypothetical protein VFY40_06500 [Blastocatellia bacterium]|nr:hypothetical protein [Blastocatellia bacterium]
METGSLAEVSSYDREKPDNLITESQSTTTPALYPFDAEFIAVPFNARPDAPKPKIVYHKLRKPTLQQLKDREAQSKTELVSLNDREDEENADNWTATINLWERLIEGVKGYQGGTDWRELTAQEKAEMKPDHKYRAVVQMYAGSVMVEYGDEDADVPIGAETWTIRHEIGAGKEPDFVVRHTLREPNEAEREKFKSARRISYVRGKHTRTRINTNLQAYCDLYDALVLSIEGATVGGAPLTTANRKAFLAQIDAPWKRKIVEVLMNAMGGQSSD